MEFSDEKWSPINFEGIKEDEDYQVSNYGRIRHFSQKLQDWKVLKVSNQRKDGTGYNYFRFKSSRGPGKQMTKAVHRLIGIAFCEKTSSDQEYVIHKDFNKTNNFADNLKWMTRREWVLHNQVNPKVIKGHEKTRGIIKNAKLTETEVIRLKKKLKRGKTKLYKVAKEFGITHTQLNRIRSGENWGHVTID